MVFAAQRVTPPLVLALFACPLLGAVAPTEHVDITLRNVLWQTLPDEFELFEKLISRPNGIFLVTGPTGLGKTTTLYAALNKLNTPDRKIITAEDPVEYHTVGIISVHGLNR